MYASYFNQFIYLLPVQQEVLTIRGAFPAFEYQGVDAFFRGLDFNWKYQFQRFELNVGGELVRASNWNTKEWLLNIPSDRYDVSIGGFVDPSSQHKVSVLATQVMKQTRVVQGLDYAETPAGFFLVGIKYEGRIKLETQDLVVSASVENLLNNEYRNYLNRLRYYAPEQGRNFILTLRIPFKI